MRLRINHNSDSSSTYNIIRYGTLRRSNPAINYNKTIRNFKNEDKETLFELYVRKVD